MREKRVAVLVTYDRAIDEELLDAISGAGVTFYTKWKEIVGVGRHDPHLGTPVWPGLNNALLAVLPAGEKDEVLERIRSLQGRFASAGLRAFVLPVLEEV
jgi:hypothetical protein